MKFPDIQIWLREETNDISTNLSFLICGFSLLKVSSTYTCRNKGVCRVIQNNGPNFAYPYLKHAVGPDFFFYRDIQFAHIGDTNDK